MASAKRMARRLQNSEVRSAKRWLKSRGLEDIPASQFARAAKEAQISFRELLMTIAQEQTGGQV